MTDDDRHSEGTHNLPVPPNTENANAFFQRTDWLGFGITTALALSVYLWTLVPSVTLEFSGILSTGAAYAGVPHPPGYPLWTIYSWCFIKLIPFSNVAWRVAIGSAVASALACGLIALMVSRASEAILEGNQHAASQSPQARRMLRVLCGYAAGIIFGFNGAFWDRAVVVDSWPLSILLFVVILSLLMRWMYAAERRRYLYAASLIYGLTLTNSQALLAAAPAFPLFVACFDRKLGRDLIAVGSLFFAAAVLANVLGWLPLPYSYSELLDPFSVVRVLIGVCAVAAVVALVLKTKGLFTEWRAVVTCVILFVAGLSSYWFVPITSMSNPPVNWGYPRTVEGFFHTLSRGQYEQIHPTEHYVDFMKQFWMYVQVTGKEFGWIYLPFAVLPFGFFCRLPGLERRWLLGLLAIFVCLSALLVALLNPGLDSQSRELNKVFFSTSYVVLAIWAGLGMAFFGATITKPSKTTS